MDDELKPQLGRKLLGDQDDPWLQKYRSLRDRLPLMNKLLWIPMVAGFPSVVVPLLLWILQQAAFKGMEKVELNLSMRKIPESGDYHNAVRGLKLYYSSIIFSIVLLVAVIGWFYFSSFVIGGR